MKKKILCIGIISIFILMALIPQGVCVNREKSTENIKGFSKGVGRYTIFASFSEENLKGSSYIDLGQSPMGGNKYFGIHFRGECSSIFISYTDGNAPGNEVTVYEGKNVNLDLSILFMRGGTIKEHSGSVSISLSDIFVLRPNVFGLSINTY